MSAALKTVDRLSPEELAFISAGTPKPQTERQLGTQAKGIPEPASVPAQDEPQPEAAPSDAPKAGRPKSSAQKDEVNLMAGIVGLSFRLPTELHHALLKASFDRKMKRQEPWTQQDIAADALSGWLKKNGYA